MLNLEVDEADDPFELYASYAIMKSVINHCDSI